MKKLIELDAAINATWKDTGYTDSLNVMTAIRDRLEALPTVDAVTVVRCKDCKYARECKYCDIWFPDKAEYMDGDYYCASGERKDGDNG